MNLEMLGVLASIFLGLLAYVFKLRGDSAMKDAEKMELEQAVEQQSANKNKEVEIRNAVETVKAEANKVDEENAKTKGSRPSGNFGDRRL
jgi:hypothetical protein